MQEEELRARKREALMQQSRREAQLSRLRFEEQRLKVPPDHIKIIYSVLPSLVKWSQHHKAEINTPR